MNAAIKQIADVMRANVKAIDPKVGEQVYDPGWTRRSQSCVDYFGREG